MSTLLQRCILDKLKLAYSTNLNDGVGKLCAGQVNVTELSISLVMPLKFRSSENFGFCPPTGSVLKMNRFF